MRTETERVGLGGGCHWCTEAVFQAVYGVEAVEQGWIASQDPNSSFSEAVIVHYRPEAVTLRELLLIHLNTHSSRAAHSLRAKYRSAAYYFDDGEQVRDTLDALRLHFPEKLVTSALPFVAFKANQKRYQNYYLSDPHKPFCGRHIEPKLKWLVAEHPELVNPEVLPIISEESLLTIVTAIPLGFSRGTYKNRTYGLEKSEYNEGRSWKLFARELGGRDFVSANIYRLTERLLVKPCEMPLPKVLAFLRDVRMECGQAE